MALVISLPVTVSNVFACALRPEEFALQDPRQYVTSFKIKNSDFGKVPGVLSDVIDYLKTAQGVDKLLPMSAKLQSLGDSSVTVGVMVSSFNIAEQQ